MTTFTSTPLYGGAIVCDVPSLWKDVSDMRQVPDHQEVYLGAMLPEEPSLVIEILEHQKSISNEKAAKYFFDDLADANGCSSSSSFTSLVATTTSNSTPTLNMFSGIGLQRVAKGRDVDMAGNPRILQIIDVHVELCVVRLPQVETDLLITLSWSKSTSGSELSEEFTRILSTLQIRDWSLFGGAAPAP